MIEKTLAAGVAGNVLSKKITGTKEVCAERSVIATGAGIGIGYATAAGTTTVLSAVGATGLAAAAAPVILPIALFAGGVACILSQLD